MPNIQVGSGSTFAYGVLDTGYRHDLTVEEAARPELSLFQHVFWTLHIFWKIGSLKTQSLVTFSLSFSPPSFQSTKVPSLFGGGIILELNASNPEVSISMNCPVFTLFYGKIIKGSLEELPRCGTLLSYHAQTREKKLDNSAEMQCFLAVLHASERQS